MSAYQTKWIHHAMFHINIGTPDIFTFYYASIVILQSPRGIIPIFIFYFKLFHLDDAEPSVAYFRTRLSEETERLNRLCQVWEEKIAKVPSTNEEIIGQIRATMGKAHLLMNKKGRFEQFSTLIDNCEFNRGDKKTTCMDLQVKFDKTYVLKPSFYGFIFLFRAFGRWFITN